MARKEAEKVALDLISELTGGHETTLSAYRDMFKSMNEKEFKEWISILEAGELPHIYAPHGDDALKPSLKQVFKFLKKYGAPVRQQLTYVYPDGRKVKSVVKHLIFIWGVRRTVQSFIKQISVAKKPGKKIDYLTGQVTGDSASTKITMPETSVMVFQGLNKTATELNKYRGGDVGTMRAMDTELFNKGTVNMHELDQKSTGVISKNTLQIYAAGAMIKLKI